MAPKEREILQRPTGARHQGRLPSMAREVLVQYCTALQGASISREPRDDQIIMSVARKGARGGAAQKAQHSSSHGHYSWVDAVRLQLGRKAAPLQIYPIAAGHTYGVFLLP